KTQYDAIVKAGFVLQLDCPDLALSRHTMFAHLSLDEFRRVIAMHVEALDHAIRDLPADRLRIHICWGSTLGPHHTDVPLRDIVLRARPMALSFPGANPRHEHEWKIWRDVALPAGKVIIPGVHRLDVELRRASRARGRAPRPLRLGGRARARDGRGRLRIRHV